MKKALPWLLGILIFIILAVFAIIARNYIPMQTQPPTTGTVATVTVETGYTGTEIVIETGTTTAETDTENPEPQVTELDGTGNITRNLTFKGMGQETQPEISGDTAVFSTPNGFPSIHLYIPAKVLFTYQLTQQLGEFATGGQYLFSGVVKLLDVAAGNRYYEAVSIDQLSQKRSQPNQPVERTEEAVKQQLENRNTCEVDDDCEAFYGECPFGCRQVANKQYVESAKQIMNEYLQQQTGLLKPQCAYKCVPLDDVVVQCGPAGTPNAGKCQIISE